MNYDDDDQRDYLEQQRLEYNNFLKTEAINLDLGKTYLQESASWAKKHFKIVLVDENVAVGVVVYCGIYNSNKKGCGSYELFNVKTGEKYGDSRLVYRLKKEVT